MKVFRSFLLFTLFASLSVFAQDVNKNDSGGKKHGLWKGVYEESKRPRYEGTFDHGKETGTFKFFDDTKAGTVIATREFRADGTVYNTFFNQKGNKVSEGKLVNKQYEGEWKYYHENSPALMTLENYRNGKLVGERKVFYKNGQLANVTNYTDGIRNGIYNKYAENKDNILLEEVTFANGKEQGDAVYRNPDGTIASKGRYENGEKKGTWEFYKNGKLEKKEKYPLQRKFQKLPPRKDF
ncbi:hypothetical protein [Flavobacterium sp.]|uniref:toxin-antitoxin system YwqK family antitoxin n=1 Tax=Flavobacterium sp. TaxID=239 RepID=UPI001206B57E|nr:hypothetical protein [Flavobacterium sp.]RZJ69640.1 MAG: hypothetical protein EOO49_16550 [Flavobacterium sp.]